MWARALCINETLETGTIFNYLKQAQAEGYGVIVFNPNLNRVPLTLDPLAFTPQGFYHPQKPKPVKREDCKEIVGSETPPDHVIHVYDTFVPQCQAKDIVIVAHSAGGHGTVELLKHRGDKFYNRLRGIAFTDSVHMISKMDPDHVKKFVMGNAINWVTSDKPLDTKIKVSPVGGCLCLSAGHEKHENTSESCRTSAFKYLQYKIDDFHAKNK